MKQHDPQEQLTGADMTLASGISLAFAAVVALILPRRVAVAVVATLAAVQVIAARSLYKEPFGERH